MPRANLGERAMTFFKKLFGGKEPVQRVRICQECGMPVADHKEWCTILRGQAEMRDKAQAQNPKILKS
jgi:hypothetical protein